MFLKNHGRSWVSYCAVFDSGRRKAILPECGCEPEPAAPSLDPPQALTSTSDAVARASAVIRLCCTVVLRSVGRCCLRYWGHTLIEALASTPPSQTRCEPVT